MVSYEFYYQTLPSPKVLRNLQLKKKRKRNTISGFQKQNIRYYPNKWCLKIPILWRQLFCFCFDMVSYYVCCPQTPVPSISTFLNLLSSWDYRHPPSHLVFSSAKFSYLFRLCQLGKINVKYKPMHFENDKHFTWL